MKRIWPLLLLLTGCQTPPAPPPPLPESAPAPRPDARIPAIVRHYTLGAYVDPDNELIRHDSHVIQRVELPARWDLRPAPRPEAVWQNLPELAAPEVAARSVAVATAVPVVEEAVPQPAVAFDPPVTAPEPALMPGPDGLIDLAALLPTDELNPFAVRSTGADSAHEITVQVGGILQGAVPCALVNGRTLQAGESVGPLVLVRVEADAALFRHAGHLFRIPVGTQPTRVRVAF